jgi:hypothetical protein
VPERVRRPREAGGDVRFAVGPPPPDPGPRLPRARERASALLWSAIEPIKYLVAPVVSFNILRTPGTSRRTVAPPFPNQNKFRQSCLVHALHLVGDGPVYLKPHEIQCKQTHKKKEDQSGRF